MSIQERHSVGLTKMAPNTADEAFTRESGHAIGLRNAGNVYVSQN